MSEGEDKPCAAVQFPHSGPKQVSWMKNSLFLRAMSRKKLVGNDEMGLNYVDFYWLSQKSDRSLIEIKIQDGMQGPLSNDINQRMVGKHGGGDFGG